MKKLLLILLCLPKIGFGQHTIDEALQIWKEELYSNKEVGPPCDYEDYHNWVDENPGFYWGIQELKEVREDFNNDGIRDAFVFFPASNCVGGNGKGSDFAVLIFSDTNNTYQRYPHLSSALEEYIAGNTGIVGNVDISDIVVRYNFEIWGLKTDVEGYFLAWTKEDPSCCSSISGEFSIDLNKVANNPKFNELAIQMKPKD